MPDTRNLLTDDKPPIDLLPDYAVIVGLDLRTLTDLLCKMEAALQQDNDINDCL